MKIVIVTGMSGAGKRTALKVLEDAGYYCVDNLPVELVLKFVELAMASSRQVNIAIGVDVRVGDTFSDLTKVLERMQHRKYEYEVLFLDADDEVLVKRYKETRRNHPLAGDHRVIEGIQKEREELAFIKDKADYIIDTSTLLTRDLKQELEKIFVDDENFKNLMVTILSFGFKYGIPEDADLVFDVRFLPNPYYVDELRPQTGMDEGVYNYVMDNETARQFAQKLEDMVEFLIPNYAKEGKTSLVIAIGCTGGKHRSVTLARVLYNRLVEKREYGIRLEHRDIGKDALLKK